MPEYKDDKKTDSTEASPPAEPMDSLMVNVHTAPGDPAKDYPDPHKGSSTKPGTAALARAYVEAQRRTQEEAVTSQKR